MCNNNKEKKTNSVLKFSLMLRQWCGGVFLEHWLSTKFIFDRNLLQAITGAQDVRMDIPIALWRTLISHKYRNCGIMFNVYSVYRPIHTNQKWKRRRKRSKNNGKRSKKTFIFAFSQRERVLNIQEHIFSVLCFGAPIFMGTFYLCKVPCVSTDLY